MALLWVGCRVITLEVEQVVQAGQGALQVHRLAPQLHEAAAGKHEARLRRHRHGGQPLPAWLAAQQLQQFVAEAIRQAQVQQQQHRLQLAGQGQRLLSAGGHFQPQLRAVLEQQAHQQDVDRIVFHVEDDLVGIGLGDSLGLHGLVRFGGVGLPVSAAEPPPSSRNGVVSVTVRAQAGGIAPLPFAAWPPPRRPCCISARSHLTWLPAGSRVMAATWRCGRRCSSCC
jgi:hypothetical protein